jgi:hypothetical protein
MSKFWWSGKIDKRGFHWQSWEKMAIPKSQGGMGFREFELFNDAMVAKQAWRLLEILNSLCARVLQGRYYPDGTNLKCWVPTERVAAMEGYPTRL